jgi:hypothetical protein
MATAAPRRGVHRVRPKIPADRAQTVAPALKPILRVSSSIHDPRSKAMITCQARISPSIERRYQRVAGPFAAEEKPLFDRILRHFGSTRARVVTVEDGTRHGGAGTFLVSAVRSRAQELRVPFPTTRILGVPRAYLEHHKPDALLAELGLDAAGLAAAFTRALKDDPEFLVTLPEAPKPTFY